MANLLGGQFPAYPQPLMTDIDSVDPLTAVEPFPGARIPIQNPAQQLAMIRAQYPFIPILPFPQSAIAAVVLAANVAQDINVPAECQIGMFISNADFWLSKDGRAGIPGTPLTSDNTSIFRPTGIWFYLGGIQQFSVIAAAPAIVQLVTLSPNPNGYGMDL